MSVQMKVCLIGFGSIGARHIKNLKELYKEDIVIDLFRSGKNKGNASEYGNLIAQTYYSFAKLPKDYDIIFITNPTAMHFETLKRCQSHGKHFFIEKPVFVTGEEKVEDLGCKEGSIYYVACPLRYTRVIQYLKNHVDFLKVYSVRCISSSYLPQWRPGTDYRKSYSAKKDMGGGVSIDLIHEWDYLCYLMGEPDKVLSLHAKKSGLEIDSEDIAVYLAEYPDKLVEVHLDYFGRIPTRKIELYTDEDVIEADLIEQRVIYKRKNNCIELGENRDEYQKRELEHFMEIISGMADNDNDIETACKTLRITRGET